MPPPTRRRRRRKKKKKKPHLFLLSENAKKFVLKFPA
jgi:hypothetical protein